LKKAKDKAWTQFSKYIRRRDANKYGVVTCVTCRRMGEWKNMQAGHFLDGRNNSILFDERGCHAQDMYCNYYGGGRGANVKEAYHAYMKKRYGQKVIDELIALKNTTVKYTIEDYAEIEAKYTDLLVGLDMRDIGRR